MDREELKNILYKIRNYEIEIRKAVNAQLRGNFASIFKGSGLEFEDVRAYQYGDDVRRIDWHVSAKGQETYVKVFKEEKEQTVFFLLDVSSSLYTGTAPQRKIDLGRELCSVLALSAVKEASEVGLLCFSDQREKYIKPHRGSKKAYEIMVNLYRMEPESSGTDLDAFIRFALNLIKRRSIVILLSDFNDQGFEDSLKALGQKHDLILIHLQDLMEYKLPRLGLIPLRDKENGRISWVNTSSGGFRRKMSQYVEDKSRHLEALCQLFRANYLTVNTQENFVPKLVKLFKARNRDGRQL